MASGTANIDNHKIEVTVLDKFMDKIMKTVDLGKILDPLRSNGVLLEGEFESLLKAANKTETFIPMLKKKDWTKFLKFREVLRLNGYTDLACVMDDEVKEIKSRKGKLPSAKTDNQAHVPGTPDSLEAASQDTEGFQIETTTKIRNLEQIVFQLGNDISRLDKERKQTLEDLRTEQKKNNKLTQCLEKREHENKELEEELATARENLSNPDQEVSRIDAERIQIQKALKNQEEETNRLRRCLEEQENKTKRLERELEAARTTSSIPNHNLDELRRVIDTLKSQISDLRQELKSKNSKICLIQ